MPSIIRGTLATLLLASSALARTDIAGCVSSATVVYGGASLIWYVPGSGEICDFLDCGGGRAPQKTDVPGCPAYSGTATYSPDYLPGYGPNAVPSSTAMAMTSATTAATSSPAITSAATMTSAAVVAAASASAMSDSSESVETTTIITVQTSCSSTDTYTSAVSSALVASVASNSTAMFSTPVMTPQSVYTGAAPALVANFGLAVGAVAVALL